MPVKLLSQKGFCEGVKKLIIRMNIGNLKKIFRDLITNEIEVNGNVFHI